MVLLAYLCDMFMCLDDPLTYGQIDGDSLALSEKHKT